jgi:Fe-S-cluster containining protein
MQHRVIPIQKAKENLAKFNARVGKKLEQEQFSLAKKLRKPRNVSEPFKVLEAIYEYTERVFQHKVGLVACRKGCSYCCHTQVAISKLEADYISNKTAVPVQPLPPTATQDLLAGSWGTDRSKPCPFLLNSECSIYEYRPLACRFHVNFEPTNEICTFEAEDKIEGLLIDRKTSFPALDRTFFDVSNAWAAGVYADIRQFFGDRNLNKRKS